MKKLILTTLFFLIIYQSFSQNFIPFQGIALDGSGKAIQSQRISLRLSILKDNASGIVSYSETHTPTTDKNGLFQVNIGTGITNSTSITSIDWSTLNYFVKVEMDVLGGGNYQLISKTKLGAVPFALYSTRSQNPAIYQNVGNTADTLKIDDNVTIVETQDGSWRQVFKLPQPTASNGQLSNRRNTTILFNCKSSFSFIVSKQNSNLRDDLQVSKGEYVLFFFDGERWMHYGGKTPQNDIKSNTYFGQNSLANLTTGRSNQAFGSGTLFENTTGSNNIAIGENSMRNNKTSNANVTIGSVTLIGHTLGDGNVAIGHNAMFSDQTSSESVAIGFNSMYNNRNGLNTGVGSRSLFQNSLGFYNSALGDEAGSRLSNGTNNTFIGHNSQGSSATVSNEITFGDANIRAIRSAVTSITSLSDARDKKNIQDLNLGLNFIQTLKPRSFQWDKREWYPGNSSDGSKVAKTATAGFIAQELDASQQKFNADWLNLVYKSNPEKMEANYGNLIPIIVKAIQDLSEENKALKIELEKLKNKQ